MKFKYLINYKLCFLLLLLPLGNSYGQLSLSAYLNSYYDDNIFNNYTAVSDFVNYFSPSVGYDIETEQNNFEFYYLGGIGFYNENQNKNFTTHKFGMVETYLFSEEGNPLNIGANYTQRQNRDDYTIYDFTQLSFYANYSQSLNEYNRIIGGYIFNKNDYKSFSVFSHLENKIFLKGAFNFDNNLALLGGVEFDNKNYLETLTEENSINSSSQLSFYFQAGLPITPSTGLSGFLSYRKNFSDGSRVTESGDYVLYEEEIFNDIYSSEGYEVGSTISQLITPTILFKAEINYESSYFPGLPIALADGTNLSNQREDDKYSFGSSIDFNLSSILSGFNLLLNWNYIKNNSNDYYYNFDNNLFSISIEWGF